MELQINGKNQTIDNDSTVTSMLTQLAVTNPLVIVERNGEVVDKEKHDETLLANGDLIEIIALMGGG